MFTAYYSLRQSREEVRHVSGKEVEGGKTQHVYFSKHLAEKGINQFLEIFLRQTENPLLANVIVVDGSPKEMMELSAQFENKPRPAAYVNDLLVNARQNSYIPETRIYDFTIMAYSQTTPILRYIDMRFQNLINVEAISIAVENEFSTTTGINNKFICIGAYL